jgi:hypothetical protein
MADGVKSKSINPNGPFFERNPYTINPITTVGSPKSVCISRTKIFFPRNEKVAREKPIGRPIKDAQIVEINPT